MHEANGREKVVLHLQVEAAGEEVADLATPVGARLLRCTPQSRSHASPPVSWGIFASATLCETAKVHASTMPCIATNTATPAPTAAQPCAIAGARRRPKCANLPATTARAGVVAPWLRAIAVAREQPLISPTWNATCISGKARNR